MRTDLACLKWRTTLAAVTAGFVDLGAGGVVHAPLVAAALTCTNLG
jgi:hypothetical protein